MSEIKKISRNDFFEIKNIVNKSVFGTEDTLFKGHSQDVPEHF